MLEFKQRPVIPSEARNLSYGLASAGMKFIVAALLLFTCSVRAQAPTPVPLAQGGKPGEPHHHLKIENEYVRAYYVEVPPHDQTQLHQHDHDYLFVTLGDSDVMNAVLNKPEVHLTLKDGEAHFTRGGFAHVARNLSDKPFRNVTIELLRPQENVRNRCEKVLNGELNDCPPSPPEGISAPIPLFETDEAIGLLFTLEANSRHVEEKMPNSALVVAFEGSDFSVKTGRKPPAEMKAGGVFWLPAGETSTFTAAGKGQSRYMLILLKDSAVKETH
jgi:quercetin dioxygenase-like cupin family protein